MMNCSRCSALLPVGANFCSACGAPVAASPLQSPEGKLRPRIDVFFLSLLGTLGLTAILTLVFHLPIFILGAFLPFFWRRGSRGL